VCKFWLKNCKIRFVLAPLLLKITVLVFVKFLFTYKIKFKMKDETAVAVLPTQHETAKFSINLGFSNELKDVLQSASDMSKMEVSPLNIATQYYDFQIKIPVRFVFLGLTEQPSADTGELSPAVALMDAEGNVFTNQGTILVATFEKGDMKIGTPVEITWIDQKKTGNARQVRTWSVKPLIAKA
jgi:hypothetical protein